LNQEHGSEEEDKGNPGDGAHDGKIFVNKRIERHTPRTSSRKEEFEEGKTNTQRKTEIEM